MAAILFLIFGSLKCDVRRNEGPCAGWLDGWLNLINQLTMPKVSEEEDGGSSIGIDAAEAMYLPSNTNDGSVAG